jgi:hypothetical protein
MPMTVKSHTLWRVGFLRERLAKKRNEICTAGTHLTGAWRIEFRQELIADSGGPTQLRRMFKKIIA